MDGLGRKVNMNIYITEKELAALREVYGTHSTAYEGADLTNNFAEKQRLDEVAESVHRFFDKAKKAKESKRLRKLARSFIKQGMAPNN